MNIIQKMLRIPSGEKVEVAAHDTWFVRWSSMTRCVRGYGKPQGHVEVFPTKADAERFARELKSAAVLLKDTQDGLYGESWGPTVEKNTYKGV